MSKQVQLSAQKRTMTGRKVKRLRKDGVIPANLFGNNADSLAIQVNAKDFATIYQQVGETGLINLNIDSETKPYPVLVADLQKDPLTDSIIHIDLRQVDLNKVTTAYVPLEFVGEAPAVKSGGIIVTVLDEVEVEALPTDLPENIVVDLSVLSQIGDSITVSKLSVEKSVKILTDIETVVALAQEPKPEVEETPLAEVTTETQTTATTGDADNGSNTTTPTT